MFIFVQPMYSKTELNADSNYVVYTALIRAMASVRPDWHWVVSFPDAQSGYKYDDDGFFSSPNVSRVPPRVSPRKQGNAITYDVSWYDRLFRSIAFDLVWCNLVEIAGHLRFAGDASYGKGAHPPVVAAHNYVIHESLPYPIHAQANVAMCQCMGASLADWNVFNSDHCQRMFEETASLWFKPEIIADVTARSTRINYGTLEPSLVPLERPGNDVPIIAYNHRLQAYKQWAKTFEVLGELWNEGLRFKVRYLNNTAENTTRILSYPFVEMRLCANRSQYLDQLRQCDLNVTNSLHETFCIAAIESMALGQPLIAPDGVTFPEITGRKELDYPYLFDDRNQQKAMIRRLLTDADERKQWGTRLSEFVRREFNSTLWAQRYAELFESLVGSVPLNPAADSLEFVRQTIDRISGSTFKEYMNAVKHKPVGDRIPFSSQSFPSGKALRLARQLGATVVMEKGEQRIYAKGSAPSKTRPR